MILQDHSKAHSSSLSALMMSTTVPISLSLTSAATTPAAAAPAPCLLCLHCYKCYRVLSTNSNVVLVVCIKMTTNHKCTKCQCKKSCCTEVRISMLTVYCRLTVQVLKKYQHCVRHLVILEAAVAATAPAPLTICATKVCLVAVMSKFKAGVELHLCCQCVAEHPKAVVASNLHVMLHHMDQLVAVVQEGVSLLLSCWWSS